MICIFISYCDSSIFYFGLVPWASLKFEEDLISGCWDIQLLKFWGHLPLEVVFISGIQFFWFCPLSLSLKFEEDLISGCWDIQLLLFCGRLPLSSFQAFLILVWSHELRSKIWGRFDQWLLSYSMQFIALSIFWGRPPLKVIFISSIFLFWFGPLSLCFIFEEDPIIGCWDIQLLIFEVFFHWRSSSSKNVCKFLFGHLFLNFDLW